MKFTLRQLEFYVALAETLQISKAAGRCHISQSSMTVAMRNLETIMNTQLFVRHPKGIELTVDGERFLSHARKILSDSEAAINDLHNQPEMTTGCVRVGIAETLSAYLLPGIYSELERRFPLLEIHFQEGSSQALITALHQQEVDFCLVLTSNIRHDDDLTIDTFLRSLRRLWAPIGHPLLSQPELRLADIAKVPFLLLETDDYPTVILDVWRQRCGQPDIRYRTNSFEAIRTFVSQGKGVTILSDLVWRPWSLEGLRVMRRTVDDCMTWMDVGVASLRQTELRPEARRVVDFLRQAIHRFDGQP